MTAPLQRTGVSVTLAAAAGAALWLSFPPYDRWWLGPVGVAGLALATRGQRIHVAALLGGVCGLTLFVPLLSFTSLQVGPWPWLLLAALQASFLAVMSAAAAYLTALLARRWWAWPLLTGALWVTQEALRSRTPFGGFPWGRLAFGQVDGPFVGLATVGGAPLVTFAVAVAGGLLAVVAWNLVGPGASGARRVRHTVRAGCAAAALTAGGVLIPSVATDGREVVVAVVQGSVPRMGLDFNAQRRAVLDNHVNATLDLAAEVAAGREEQPDLVVWPENSSDVDPLADADAGRRITAAARAIGAPILVGAVLQGPQEGTVRNVGLVWTPEDGPVDSYVKRHPVPFAEYVPWRSFVRRIVPLVDRVRADFVAGDRVGVLAIGPVRVGDVICFEVAYDALVRDTVIGGAQLLAVQTNNATFNYAEAVQQLAMVRLRAVEHGRPAVMASTVGVSAFVDPDATVRQATAMNEQAVVVRRVRLATADTLATRLGATPEWLLAGALIAVLVAATNRRRVSHNGLAVDLSPTNQNSMHT